MDIETKNQMSAHHIIPKTRGGEDTPENKVYLTKWIHRKWHDLFRELTPEEAIEWIKTVMVVRGKWERKKIDKLYKQN
jgi:hypothetical protein